jgi:hypothetical protein
MSPVRDKHLISSDPCTLLPLYVPHCFMQAPRADQVHADYSGEFSHWNFSMRIKNWIDQSGPYRTVRYLYPCLHLLSLSSSHP